MKWLRNTLMDAASRALYRISPYHAGAFDAWCDNHGRWN